tara:strand:- start:1309 stop:1638 length:330 start_codon:yes stop_codon:yes gene_type:complete
MKRLLLPLLAALALPTAVNADSMATQKGYAAGVSGVNLCLMKKGLMTKKNYILTIENLMLKRGYDIDLLYKSKVKRAGNFIANNLGSNCNNQKIFDDKILSEKILNILY